MAMSRTWSSGVAHSVGFARNSAGFLRTEGARVSRGACSDLRVSYIYTNEKGTLVLSLVEIALSGRHSQHVGCLHF
jgi:hypothetical protein